MKMLLEHYKLINTTIIVLYLVLCIYQLSQLCQLYLQYKTTVSMNFRSDSVISLPAITLCISKKDLLKIKDPAYFHFFFNHEYTIAEQAYNLTWSANEAIECLISELNKNCTDLSKVHTLINQFDICFTLFYQDKNEQGNRFNYKIKDLFNPVLINIKLAKEPPSLALWIHPRRHEKRIYYYQDIIAIANAKSQHLIQYRRTITQSLPKPYETNCFDYNTLGYNDKLECLLSCQANYFKQRAGFTHIQNYQNITSHEGYIRLQDDISQFEENNPGYENDCDQYCAALCDKGIECLKEKFQVDFVRKFDDTYVSDTYKININKPSVPDFEIVHSPKMSLEEFISLSASIISFYFGVSVISVTNLILNWLKLYVDKVKLRVSHDVHVHVHDDNGHNSNHQSIHL